MCLNHDHTYSYSDDHRYWIAGFRSYESIMAAANVIGMSEATVIWNEVVRGRFPSKEGRDRYCWDEIVDFEKSE